MKKTNNVKGIKKMIICGSLAATMAFGTVGFAEYNPDKVIDPSNPIMTLGVGLDDNSHMALSKIFIGDVEIETIVKDHILMLPLRSLVEKCNYKVQWDAETYTANINNDKIKADIKIGENLYFYSSVEAVGMSKPSPLATAPILEDNKTYVPYDFVTAVMGLTFEETETDRVNIIETKATEPDPIVGIEPMFKELTKDLEFPAMVEMPEDYLNDSYGIDLKILKDYKIDMSMMNVKSSEIALFEVNDAKDIEAVKAGIEKRQKQLDGIWKTYLVDQYELVKNYKLIVKDNFVLFVISEHADKIVENFNNHFVK